MSLFTHAPPYSIAGQSGKPLDAAMRTLEAMSITSAVVQYRSQDADSFIWSQRAGTEPEWMQEITLLDATGKRILHGNITEVEPSLNGAMTMGYNVTVSGPWWWLEQVALTDLYTDSTGTATEAPCFVTPQQDLAISIRALLDRLQAIGVPLRCGNIDPTFTVPRMVFTNETGADALRIMLSWLPDAMTRVRYDDGIPALDVIRRSTAEPVQIDLAVTGHRTGAPIRLRPRHELRPEAVEVQSMTLDAAGEIVYHTHRAGIAAPSPIRRQILPISGIGKTGKPDSSVRRYLLKTLPFSPTSDLYTALCRHHSGVSSLKTLTGSTPYDSLVSSNITIWVPINNGFTQYVITPSTSYTSADGETSVAPSKYIVMGEDLPDWWSATGIAAQRVKARHRWTWSTANGYTHTAAVAALSNYQISDAGGTYFFADLEIDVWTVDYNAGNTTGVVIVHPDDAALVQPNDSLADNLWAAQDWTPYEGSIPQQSGSQHLAMPGSVIDITGTRAEWENMKALTSGISIDLRNGSGEITLGSPPRQRASALIDRFRTPTSGAVMKL